MITFEPASSFAEGKVEADSLKIVKGTLLILKKGTLGLTKSQTVQRGGEHREKTFQSYYYLLFFYH